MTGEGDYRSLGASLTQGRGASKDVIVSSIVYQIVLEYTHTTSFRNC